MKAYLSKVTHAGPLAVFRIATGLLLFAGVVRFWANGWIDQLYIQPKHFFTFYGFAFVSPLGQYTYVLFALCGLSALLVAIGLWYRFSSVTLFLSFTYIELIDKSTYLNHYYFISMVLLMLIFLPAHVYFSVDAHRNAKLKATLIPAWSVDAIKIFVCMVYVYAGLAKVNSDWLLEARPLRIWLPAKNDLPLLGPLLNKLWVAYAFSWAGCIYDLTIPFLLLRSNTRLYAYFAVIVFHVLTAILFPIGMFPYIMIATALIYFSPGFHQRLIARIQNIFSLTAIGQETVVYHYRERWSNLLPICFSVFLLIQILLPFRHVFYPGELFWTEEGYRFSWRVMLMEKAGHAQFTVKDANGNAIIIDNREFLTPIQEKMMATQPDMMLQYAHILRDHYSKNGFRAPEVYVDSYVTLNGRIGIPLIDPNVDLAAQEDSFHSKPWILPFRDEIAGF